MRNIISYFPEDVLLDATEVYCNSKNISFSGAGDSSSKAMIMSDICRQNKSKAGNVLWIVNDASDQNIVKKAMEMWSGRSVYLYTKKAEEERLSYATSSEFERAKRIELVEFVSRVFLGNEGVFVLNFESILQNFPDMEEIAKEKLAVKKGGELDSVKLIEKLVDMGYEVTDDEVLKRGGILSGGGQLVDFSH